MGDASDLLRSVRERHGLEQRQLARRAGTSQAQVSRIERGETTPSVQTLDRLLAATGERLELRSRPVKGNRRPSELREDYERLTATQRLAQASRLSRTLTGVAAGRRTP